MPQPSEAGSDEWAALSTPKSYANEAAVEHQLVVPLLSALGFESSDIQPKVKVSFTRGTKQGRPFEADYVTYSGALHDEDTSLMVVEVKAPGKSLDDAKEQGESYAFQLRTPVLLVTNGSSIQVWQVQISRQSECVLDIEVASLAARRVEVELVLSKAALIQHAEKLAFKKISPAADYSKYETAEVVRAQGTTIARRLLADNSKEVSSTDLLDAFPNGAVIFAPSGYGKTMLSRDLVVAGIKRRWAGGHDVPLAAEVPLLDFAAGTQSVLEFIAKRIAAQQPEITLVILERQARDAGLLVICDGMEYVAQAQREGVDLRLRLFRRDYPKSQLFVFSRASTPVGLGLPRLTLQALDAAERRALVAASGVDVPLWNLPRLLEELSAVPVILRRIIDYYAEKRSFPDHLPELFEHWLTQFRDGTSGSPGAKAQQDAALLLIARELVSGQMPTTAAFAAVVGAGLPESAFDALINTGAVTVNGNWIKLAHDTLGDYLRARTLADLPQGQFQKALAQTTVQDHSLLPVLLVLMVKNQEAVDAVWHRLKSLPLERYIDTIRFSQTPQVAAPNGEDAANAFPASFVDGLEGMICGFFPEIGSILRARLARVHMPLKAVEVRGSLQLDENIRRFTFTIEPTSSLKSSFVSGMPTPVRWYHSSNLPPGQVSPGVARYMSALAVREAMIDVGNRHLFKGGTLLANERAISRLHFLHEEYGLPLAIDDPAEELIERLSPNADKFVSLGTSSGFTIQSVIDDLRTVQGSDREFLDWWWLEYGHSADEIYADRERARNYLIARYTRSTALYFEVVEASFTRLARSFSYYAARPFRWELLIKEREMSWGRQPSLSWQWVPVATQGEAMPVCYFEGEKPEDYFDSEAALNRIKVQLDSLERSVGRYGVGSQLFAPAPDEFTNSHRKSFETGALKDASAMIAYDIKALFRDLPPHGLFNDL